MKNKISIFIYTVSLAINFLICSASQADIEDLYDVNGEINVVKEDDDHIYIGGNFSHLCSDEHQLEFISLLDGNSIQNNFNSGKSFCGEMHSVVSIPEVGILIGGQFSLTVNQDDRIFHKENFVLIKNDGTVDENDFPIVNGPVHQISYFIDNGRIKIYIAGKYNEIKLEDELFNITNFSLLEIVLDEENISEVFVRQILDDDFEWSENVLFKDILIDISENHQHLYLAGRYKLRRENESYEALVQLDLNNNIINNNFSFELDPKRDGSVPSINTLLLDEDMLYIGGNFSVISRGFWESVGGVAKITLSPEPNRSPFLRFRGNFNGPVNKLILHEGFVYVGGEFTSANWIDRAHLAKLNADTGQIQENFARFNFMTRFNSHMHKVYDMILDDDFLYLVGSFDDFTGWNLGPSIMRVNLAEDRVDHEWDRSDQASPFKVIIKKDNQFIVGIEGGIKSPNFSILRKGTFEPIATNVEISDQVNDILLYEDKIFLGGKFHYIFDKLSGQTYASPLGLASIDKNNYSFDDDIFRDIRFPEADMRFNNNEINTIVELNSSIHRVDPGINQIIAGGKISYEIWPREGNGLVENYGLIFFEKQDLNTPFRIRTDFQDGTVVNSMVIVYSNYLDNNRRHLVANTILGGNMRVISEGVPEPNIINLAKFSGGTFSSELEGFVSNDNFDVKSLEHIVTEDRRRYLYVAGKFSQSRDRTTINNLIRLYLGGFFIRFDDDDDLIGLDLQFNTGLDENDIVKKLSLNENKVYISGSFDHAEVKNFAVLWPNGTIRRHYNPNPIYPNNQGFHESVNDFLISDFETYIVGKFSQTNDVYKQNFMLVDQLLDDDGDGINNHRDCAPSDPTKEKIVFKRPDRDGDGYAQEFVNSIRLCVGENEENQEPGFVWFDSIGSIRNDCNDNDPELARWVYNLFPDSDNDGYPDRIINPINLVCSDLLGTIPHNMLQNSPELRERGPDCDVENPDLFRSLNLIADTDNDGYVDTLDENDFILSCLGEDIPGGFVELSDDVLEKGRDCDINDDEKYIQIEAYLDKDKDGFPENMSDENIVSFCSNENFELEEGYLLRLDSLKEDNCKNLHNPNQKDSDNDGLGDVCDDDFQSSKENSDFENSNEEKNEQSSGGGGGGGCQLNAAYNFSSSTLTLLFVGMFFIVLAVRIKNKSTHDL